MHLGNMMGLSLYNKVEWVEDEVLEQLIVGWVQRRGDRTLRPNMYAARYLMYEVSSSKP